MRCEIKESKVKVKERTRFTQRGRMNLRIGQGTSSNRSTKLRNLLPSPSGFWECTPAIREPKCITTTDQISFSDEDRLTSYFFHWTVHLGLHASVNSGSLSTGSSYKRSQSIWRTMRNDRPYWECKRISSFIYHFRDNINYNRGGTVYRMSSTGEKDRKKRPTVHNGDKSGRMENKVRAKKSPHTILCRCVRHTQMSKHRRVWVCRHSNRFGSVSEPLQLASQQTRWSTMHMSTLTNPTTHPIKSVTEYFYYLRDLANGRYSRHRPKHRPRLQPWWTRSVRNPRGVRRQNSTSQTMANQSIDEYFVTVLLLLLVFWLMCRWWRKMPEPSPWIAGSRRRRKTRWYCAVSSACWSATTRRWKCEWQLRRIVLIQYTDSLIVSMFMCAGSRCR